jgi:hypothetical protein
MALNLKEVVGIEANDIAIVDSSVGKLEDLRRKDAKPLRDRLLMAAMNLIFGVFNKEIGGGDYVGTVLKALLKIDNGGKSVKARTVTEQMIANITTERVMLELDALRERRKLNIAGIAKEKLTSGEPQADVDVYVKKATTEMEANFTMAQEWFNRAWNRVPACMKAIRVLGGGQVTTIDGATKPTALAFEQVLLNRSETARAFAKVVDRKRGAVDAK